MNILFVCSECRLRSPTAAAVCDEWEGVEATSAGTNADALTPLSGDLIEWADVILVMEEVHRRKVAQRYRELLRGKKLAVLGVADRYRYMDPELVDLVERIVPRYLGGVR
ncbi:MAG: phosphotyrosine protein phosphatase [Planctomycetota bacterium]